VHGYLEGGYLVRHARVLLTCWPTCLGQPDLLPTELGDVAHQDPILDSQRPYAGFRFKFLHQIQIFLGK